MPLSQKEATCLREGAGEGAKKMNSTLGSVVPLAMFVFIRDVIAEKMFQSCQRYMLGGLSLAVEIDESMFGKYTS